MSPAAFGILGPLAAGLVTITLLRFSLPTQVVGGQSAFTVGLIYASVLGQAVVLATALLWFDLALRRVAERSRIAALSTTVLAGYVLSGAALHLMKFEFGGQWARELLLIPGVVALMHGAARLPDLLRLTDRGDDSRAALHGDAALGSLVVFVALSENVHKFANVVPETRTLGVGVLALGAGLSFAIALTRSDRRVPRIGGLAALALVGAALLYLEASLYQRLYHSIHLSLWLAAVGAWARLDAAVRQPDVSVKRLGPCTMAAALLAITPMVDFTARREIVDRPTPIGRLLSVSGRHLGDFLLEEPPAFHEMRPDQTHETTWAGPTEPSLIFVTIDALRADHFTPEHTPNGWRIASRGTLFTQTFTPFPTTRPTMRAAFSGALPGNPRHSPAGFPTRDVLVWSRLQQAGYRTAYTGLVFDRLQHRMDLVDETALDTRGDEVASRFIATLDELATDPAPFAAWVHLFDPHNPYSPQSEPASDSALDRYAACVRDADDALGRIDEWAASRAGERPIYLFVFGDHGEEFGEHGAEYHASSAYNEQVRIPLAIVGPDVHPSVVESTVSLVDVGPTIASLARIELPAGIDGRSLVPFLRGEELPPLLAPIAVRPLERREEQRAAVLGRWKVIRRHVSGTFEVYDIESDPREMTDLSDELERVPEVLWRALGLQPR